MTPCIHKASIALTGESGRGILDAVEMDEDGVVWGEICPPTPAPPACEGPGSSMEFWKLKPAAAAAAAAAPPGVWLRLE